MIDTAQQWCQQIDVTNLCPRRCSNCTRMLTHARNGWAMDPDTFRQAVAALADFPEQSPPDLYNRHKVIGLIGGEPLLHPQFPNLCRIFAELVPDRARRGLWTSADLDGHPYQQLIGETFGYLNHNPHQQQVVHQPILVAVRELVEDPADMWRLIEDCWLQKMWSGAITPKGYFYCEVAAAFDAIFDGPGGLPIEPGCWARPLDDHRELIERWCIRCGACVPLEGRDDWQQRDDISPGNLEELKRLRSPRVRRGEVVLFDAAGWCAEANRPGWNPQRYLRGER